MSALAKFMLSVGKRVGGSDNVCGAYTEELEELGANVEVAENKRSVSDYDVIVYTDAVSENDIQLQEAKNLQKTVLSRGRLLYEVSRAFKKVIAVSGCHGKTTCTSMLAHIFAAAGKKFCAHIGGKDKAFSNFYYCGNEIFLTEACEYKKNFLLLKPDIAVILNSDPDHLECYGSEEELRKAYVTFAQSADVCVNAYGDLSLDGITFGLCRNSDYSAQNLVFNSGCYGFTVYDGAVCLGQINLNVYGKHNVLNALAAIAAARIAEIPFDKIVKGLESFTGVERRFEKIGTLNGAACIADYAHHPNEIAAALISVRNIAKGKLFVVFQPHTYSRTKNLFGDFVRVLSPLENLLIYRTFAAREYFDERGCALTLSQNIKRSVYGDCPRDIIDFTQNAGGNDTILFLGAGDIYDIAKNIINSEQTR